MSTHTLLEVSAWTGVLAAMMLTYRLLSSWHVTSRLTKAVALTLLLVIIGQAYGSSQTIHQGVHLQGNVVEVIFLCRLAVVALCTVWPWRE
jgi:hypothetical protein